MVISFFVGLAFGFTGYQIFLAPSVRLRAAKLGMLTAASELKAWMNWMPADFRKLVEDSMSLYNLERLISRLEQLDAKDVAAGDSEKKP